MACQPSETHDPILLINARPNLTLCCAVQVQRPGMWAQLSLDLTVLTQLLRLLRWVGRIKQDITLWAHTLGEGLAQELDYEQVWCSV